MIDSPFRIFGPFKDRLRVELFTKEDRIQNDEDTARLLGSDRIVSENQVHGTKVVRVDGPSIRMDDADGMITATKSLWLTVRSADCQTFVIYAPEKNVVGVLHAGWRGIEANAIASFYEKLKDEWGIEPNDTFVGAAPSLCLEHSEFTDPARELPSVPKELTKGRLVDLCGAADRQFEQLGVPKDHRERMPGCNACEPDTYWTYRGGDKEEVRNGWRNVLACELL